MPDFPDSTKSLRSFPPASSRIFAWNATTSGWTLVLLALGVCWFFLIEELSAEWRINAQYGYGFAVPLLCLALIWRRWPGRPPIGAGANSWVGFAVVLLLLWLPAIRIGLQANPEWRLLYWLHAFQCVGLAFCLLYWIGGRSWVRFFAPAILFMLIAVPWPMGLENWVIQGLMRLVAGLTVEVVGWLGIPAVQQGNLIETTVGFVGIDEACSGVRSLQSALMLSLFLGEMYRMTVGRRLGLLSASLAFDLLANLLRTSFLVWAAANRGLAQMEAWHDLAGWLVMIIVLPGVLGLAQLIKSRATGFSSHDRAEPGPHPIQNDPRPIPQWVGVSALIWLAVGEVAAEAWYRLHETKLIASTRWSVAWPAQSNRFRKTAVAERALTILRCSDSEAAGWEDEAGNQWNAFLLRWKPGRNSAQLAKGHRPDICFPAAGAHFVQDFGQASIPVRDFEIPFRHQTFDRAGRVIHVFYCLWADRISPDEKPLLEDGSQRSRMLAVLAGKRNLGQQVLEVVIDGPESESDALSVMRSSLPALVQVE